MSEWQSIETFEIPPFNAERWYADVARVLVVCGKGGYVQIATYGYTQRGKGRWQDRHDRVCVPTHWMPLPPPPATP